MGEKYCSCGMLEHACKCDLMPEKISIIIPVYNGEDYINDAIKNALRQTYPNFEVIVVDDGSTDKTLLNLERDPLSKEITIIEKKNGGVGSALNAGIRAMTGQWFKWLSADDMLETNCLEVMMEEINKTPNNKNKIYYTNYNIIDNNGKITETIEEQNRNELSWEIKCSHLYHLYYGNATTCMIHKSVFGKVGMFDEKIKNGDDYDFWLRAMFGGWEFESQRIELWLIPKTLASYRRHDNQLTNRRGSELFKTIKEIRRKNLELLPVELQKFVTLNAKLMSKLPIKTKMRHKCRDIIFSIMPNKFNNKLLSIYQQRKKHE
jgi:glycosyltransferase involved in cell wall biosynthesis